jgi:sugar phosphate isomerase/epimerase
MARASSLELSLAYLTVAGTAPPRMVEIAAYAGFRHVGLRLAPARRGEQPWPLRPGTSMLRETQARLQALNVRVHDVEVVRLRPDLDVAALAPVLEAAQALGARWLLVNGDDPDPARSAAHLHALCDAAAAHGLRVGVEFMVYTALSSLAQARALVQAAQHPAAFVVMDTLHCARAGATPQDMGRVPELARGFAQINDAPRQRHPGSSPSEEGRAYRLLPGEGDLPVGDYVRQLDAGAVLSVESPHAVRAAHLAPADMAHLAWRQARSFLGNLA